MSNHLSHSKANSKRRSLWIAFLRLSFDTKSDNSLSGSPALLRTAFNASKAPWVGDWDNSFNASAYINITSAQRNTGKSELVSLFVAGVSNFPGLSPLPVGAKRNFLLSLSLSNSLCGKDITLPLSLLR